MLKEHYKPGWDLTTIPDHKFISETQRRRGARGGRPAVLRACPRCKESFTGREMWRHKSQCKAASNAS